MNMGYDEDESEEEIDESELPAESDLDDSDDSDTIPCPHCGKPVYGQADVCPSCGSFIDSQTSSRRPLWIVLIALAVIAAMVVWAVCR